MPVWFAHSLHTKSPTLEFWPSALDSRTIFREEPVAAKQPKADIYRTLYRLNRAFDFITEQLPALVEAGLIGRKSLRDFQGYTQELQAEFNQELLEAQHQIELDDWGRFGKIRQAREKELRDPDDVFIHAKERRQELKKQELKKKKRKPNKKKP